MSLPKIFVNAKVKRNLIWAGGVLVFLFILFQFLENFLEKEFKTLMNSNPERAYDLTYEKLDLDILGRQVKMKGIAIIPIQTDSAVSTINGEVAEAELAGFGVLDFLMRRSVTIDELRFLKPEFRLLYTNREQTSKSSGSFQNLFKDIISRGEIRNFILADGKAELFLVSGDSIRRIGAFREFNIKASGLSTDLVRLNYAIPFEFDNIHTSFSDLDFQVEPGKNIQLDKFLFDFQAKELDLNGVSMSLSQPWQQVAKEQEFQGDIIEFYIKSLKIKGLSPESSFYDSLVISSQKLEVDSLVLRDGRDKNIVRPPDVVKKNFASLLKTLNTPIQVDTIQIFNSHIEYSEINKGSIEAGTLTLSEVNATILNTTSLDSMERIAPWQIDLSAKLNGAGDLKFELKEIYETLKFEATLSLGPMDMTALNPTLVHMAGMRIKSGRMRNLTLSMGGDLNKATNNFAIEYENLEVELLNSSSEKKSGLINSLAKLAYHKNFNREEKHYQEPSYTTLRNVYRGPINFIWLSAKDGLMKTIPSGATQMILSGSKGGKKSQRKARKEAKKKAKGKGSP